MPSMASQVTRCSDTTHAISQDIARVILPPPDRRAARVEASLAFERDEVAQQSIPHETMIAGLLAASRMRPKLVIDPAPMTMDPWAAGIARLQQMTPLDGFSAPQWKMVQHGCASLLNSHGAEMTRLGWTVEDAFGVHPEVPGTVHAHGLGILLGCKFAANSDPLSGVRPRGWTEWTI